MLKLSLDRFERGASASGRGSRGACQRHTGASMSSNLRDLTKAIYDGSSLRLHRPEDRAAETAKIARLRQLRLAATVGRKRRRRAKPIIVTR
jgi:hypothetical protein